MPSSIRQTGMPGFARISRVSLRTTRLAPTFAAAALFIWSGTRATPSFRRAAFDNTISWVSVSFAMFFSCACDSIGCHQHKCGSRAFTLRAHRDDRPWHGGLTGLNGAIAASRGRRSSNERLYGNGARTSPQQESNTGLDQALAGHPIEHRQYQKDQQGKPPTP
jgi:hypothetical protein